MPFGWVAGAVAVAGAVQADSARKSANKATDSQERIAGQQLDMSKEQLDWAKKQYADEAPARLAAEKRAQEVSDASLTGMKYAMDQAKEAEAYNKTTFRPLEQSIVSEAQAYDTPERRAAQIQAAETGVDSSLALTRQANERALARSGVAPGSTRMAALMEDSAISGAKVRAGAGYAAGQQVEQQGFARKMDAASLGRGLASAQATQQGIATTSGNASVGAGMSGLNATESGKGNVNTGYAGAQNGLASAGGMYAGIAQSFRKQEQAGYDTMASAGNMYAQYKSDEEVKSGTGKPADTKKALQEIVDTPVEDGWRYDPAKGGPDDGGKKHIGPMAQQVQRISGNDAAPEGKAISIVDEMGRMRAAIQELAKDQGKKQSRKSKSKEVMA